MNMRKIVLAAASATATAAIVTGCFFDYPDPTVDAAAITLNDRAVHDPSVIRTDDGTFYVFGSHLAAARSTDLMQWDYVANGLDASNPLWSTIPLEGNQWTGIPGSWAADVIKLKDGKYHFYYSFCGVPPGGQCTGPRSYLGSAVSDRIEGPYVDRGIFLRSGLSAAEIAAGYATPRRHQLRRARHAEHDRSRRVLRQARQALDGLRLVLGRHLHPRDGPGHRQADARPGLRQAPRRRRPRADRGRVHALQPRERATTIYSRRSAASRRTTATTSASRDRETRRPVPRRRRAATWSTPAATRRTSRRSA